MKKLEEVERKKKDDNNTNEDNLRKSVNKEYEKRFVFKICTEIRIDCNVYRADGPSKLS